MAPREPSKTINSEPSRRNCGGRRNRSCDCLGSGLASGCPRLLAPLVGRPRRLAALAGRGGGLVAVCVVVGPNDRGAADNSQASRSNPSPAFRRRSTSGAICMHLGTNGLLGSPRWRRRPSRRSAAASPRVSGVFAAERRPQVPGILSGHCPTVTM